MPRQECAFVMFRAAPSGRKTEVDNSKEVLIVGL